MDTASGCDVPGPVFPGVPDNPSARGDNNLETCLSVQTVSEPLHCSGSQKTPFMSEPVQRVQISDCNAGDIPVLLGRFKGFSALIKPNGIDHNSKLLKSIIGLFIIKGLVLKDLALDYKPVCLAKVFNCQLLLD